jgi:UPF0716 family protein affecting phage T7 exclusion
MQLRNLGTILLGIWLILTGLLPLVTFQIPGAELILAILAIAAGVLLLLRPGQISRTWGVILLCAWLILSGLVAITTLAIPGGEVVLGLLAIAAGILILLGR